MYHVLICGISFAGGRKADDDIPKAGRVLSIVGLIFIAICFVLCVVSYCAPFWLLHRTEYFEQVIYSRKVCFGTQILSQVRVRICV